MKTLINILLLSLSLYTYGSITYGDNPRDLILNTQKEVNNLKYIEEVGNLIIASEGVDQIVDLSKLSSIKNIQGNLYVINNQALETLQGLDTFKLSGSAFIQGNKKLRTANFFIENNIINDFIVKNNDSLVSFSSLSKIESLRDLVVENNYSLDNLNSFESVKEVTGDISIIGNSNLQFLKPFVNLISYEGKLTVQNNKSLYDAQVIYKLYTMAKESVITGNTIFTSDLKLMKIAYDGTGDLRFNYQEEVDEFGLSYQKDVFKGDILIDRSKVKNLDGLSILSEVDGMLIIKRNDSLTSVKGLSNIKRINHLIISFNKSLITLKGLENITNVKNDIVIYRNTELEDVSSISANIRMGGKLVIEGNPKLRNNKY